MIKKGLALVGVVILSIICFKLIRSYNTLDGFFDNLLVLTLGDNTEYDAGYTNEKFEKLRPGLTLEMVENIITRPQAISLNFKNIDCAKEISFFRTKRQPTWQILMFTPKNKDCTEKNFDMYKEMGMEELIKKTGPPETMLWSFSWPQLPHMPFRLRSIWFSGNTVTKKSAYFYTDR